LTLEADEVRKEYGTRSPGAYLENRQNRLFQQSEQLPVNPEPPTGQIVPLPSPVEHHHGRVGVERHLQSDTRKPAQGFQNRITLDLRDDFAQLDAQAFA
jgi:hypothetical protein